MRGASTRPLTETKLTEALTYSVNQRTNLETFMHDGKIPISDNRAEQHIRPFATHRRAWLFADTQAGARANAAARSYDLNVYEYIHYVLRRMSALDHQRHPVRLEELMPWAENIALMRYQIHTVSHGALTQSSVTLAGTEVNVLYEVVLLERAFKINYAE